MSSASERRKMLLQQIGLEFEVFSPEISETYDQAVSIQENAQRVAKNKVVAAGKHFASGLVVGADTVMVNHGQILTKPKDHKAALDMLQSISDQECSVITGLVLYDIVSQEVRSDAVVSYLKIKKLSKDEINGYILTGEPWDKAGGLAIQGLGGVLVEYVKGDYYNIVGLPINRLYSRLMQLGIQVL